MATLCLNSSHFRLHKNVRDDDGDSARGGGGRKSDRGGKGTSDRERVRAESARHHFAGLGFTTFHLDHAEDGPKVEMPMANRLWKFGFRLQQIP